MNDYKSKTALYLRKSRADDQAEDVETTLNKHIHILTEYAIKNGITISGVYKEVVSGERLFNRPEMNRLLADVEDGQYTAVMCMEIDRLGRSSNKDSGIIMETLQDNGCKIITPTKTYDLDNEADEMTVDIKTFVARHELKAIRKRLVAGEIETMKAGGHTGEPPYGYKRCWIGKRPSLEQVPEEAETVKLIFDKYVNGVGTYSIARYLNTLGIKAPGGGDFSRSSVRMILMNPIYKGDIVWGKTKRIKRKKPGDKWRDINIPKENWVIAKGMHEPIVSEEVWAECEKIRTMNTRAGNFRGVIHNRYSKLIFCSKCQTALQRQVDKKTNTERLLCTTTGCMPSCKMSAIDKIVISELKKLKAELTVNKGKREEPKTEEFEKDIKRIETQITQTKNQRNKLHDFLEQGVYDVETFMQRQGILIEKLNSLEEEKEKAEAALNEINTRQPKENILPTIEELIKEWDNLNGVEQNKMLKKVIKRITYTRTSNKPDADITAEIDWRL